jgi:hypothetical protein
MAARLAAAGRAELRALGRLDELPWGALLGVPTGCITCINLASQVRFVVMGNLFNTDLLIHRRFDLKGSTVGRTCGVEARQSDDCNVILKVKSPSRFDLLQAASSTVCHQGFSQRQSVNGTMCSMQLELSTMLVRCVQDAQRADAGGLCPSWLLLPRA